MATKQQVLAVELEAWSEQSEYDAEWFELDQEYDLASYEHMVLEWEVWDEQFVIEFATCFVGPASFVSNLVLSAFDILQMDGSF